MTERTINVGLLGCGNVGTVVAKRLISGGDAIASRSGVAIKLVKIGVLSTNKQRDAAIPTELFTDNLASIVEDPNIDVIIEVMGGVNPARDLILSALRAHKPVVTANKELLATHPEVIEEAANNKVDLLFEAAVGGGIPVIRPLRESLAGERISRVVGIVNGTTNYILSAMSEKKVAYPHALAEAQKLGYAETDPSADVEGRDAAAKAAILASLAFGNRVVLDDVSFEGIEAITIDDLAVAESLDCVVKLLAIVEQDDDGAICARVNLTLVSKSHPLSAVNDAFNAIFIEGEGVGELMLYGRGAGGEPTASAVIGDVIDAAHNLRAGGTGRTPLLERAMMLPIGETRSPVFVELIVRDQPGVLAQVATVFADNNVSLRSVEQVSMGDEARLLFVTHMVRDADMTETLRQLSKLDAVAREGTVMKMLAT